MRIPFAVNLPTDCRFTTSQLNGRRREAFIQPNTTTINLERLGVTTPAIWPYRAAPFTTSPTTIDDPAVVGVLH
jgi:hypothetical protein